MSAADPLSDVLRNVQLRGAVFYHVNLGRRWAVEAPPASHVASIAMPGAQHVMEFHLVARGQGWALVDGEAPVPLRPGDLIVFPQGDAHVLCSELDLKPARRSSWSTDEQAGPGGPLPIAFHYGEARPYAEGEVADADTVLLCGFLGCHARPFTPLFSALPRVLHLAGGRSSPWMAAVIEQAVRESSARKAGGSALLERMSEMMFLDTLRRYLEDLPPESRGWFAGLRDRYVGNALAAIHARPGHDWSVEELGRAVGLSRSVLHERFTAVMGDTPGQYIMNWRIQLGAQLLSSSRRPVIAIANDVGYASEAAFSRAFKRVIGEPPSVWRRARQRSTD